MGGRLAGDAAAARLARPRLEGLPQQAPLEFLVQEELVVDARQIGVVNQRGGDDDAIGRILVVVGKQNGSRCDLASHFEAFDSRWSKGGPDPVLWFNRES